MKRGYNTIFVIALLGALLGATAVEAQKNIVDVEYRTIPHDFQELLKSEPESWNFNFRKYDMLSASQLWTDPNVIRDAMDGHDTQGEAPTALHISCNGQGITLLLFAGEPDFQETTRAGQTSRSSIELFFEPGTSETTSIVPYYQMIVNMKTTTIDIFDWLMEDQEYRSLQGHVTVESRFLPNGSLMRLFIPWLPLFDRLPFEGGKNNIWRLSVIRWGAKGGGQTWGGQVHSHSGAGYIRFPDFTPAQQSAIRLQILQKAWHEYHACLQLPHYNPALVKPPANLLATKVGHRSFMNYNEEFGFRAFWLEQAVSERTELGRGIADFEQFSQEEQNSFYHEAAAKLFNFKHDVEAAYRRYLHTRLFDQ